MNKGWDFSLHFFHTFILHSLLLSHFFFFPLLPGSATSQGLEITKMPHNVSFPQTRESCLSVALPFQWDDPVLRQPGCSFTVELPVLPYKEQEPAREKLKLWKTRAQSFFWTFISRRSNKNVDAEGWEESSSHGRVSYCHVHGSYTFL